MGVPLAHEKTEGPVTSITFLGIELDSINQCCRLPEEKLTARRVRLLTLSREKKVTLRQLQELVGHLNFACRVIAPGRAFLHQFCNAMSGIHLPHHRVRVTATMREDLSVWIRFLDGFNGVSVWRRDLLLEAEMQFHSDASGSYGLGLFGRTGGVQKSGPKLGRSQAFVET